MDSNRALFGHDSRIYEIYEQSISFYPLVSCLSIFYVIFHFVDVELKLFSQCSVCLCMCLVYLAAVSNRPMHDLFASTCSSSGSWFIERLLKRAALQIAYMLYIVIY